MVYRQDNRPKKHRGRYTVLGLVLGICFAFGLIYVYDNYRQPIVDNVNQIKTIAVEQLPKQNQIIQSSNPLPVQDNNIQNIQQEIQPTQELASNTNITPNTNTINTIELEKQIHDQINIIRGQAGMKLLNYDDKVASIAREHSKDMALNNYFDHTSPSGQTLQDRFYKARLPCNAGENIEINYITTPELLQSIIQTWTSSLEHRNNILYPYYTSEGIGVFINSENVLITEDFC